MKKLLYILLISIIYTGSYALAPASLQDKETNLLIKRLNSDFKNTTRDKSYLNTTLGEINFVENINQKLTFTWEIDSIIPKVTNLDKIIINKVFNYYFSTDRDFPEVEVYLSSILRELILNAAKESAVSDNIIIEIYLGESGIAATVNNAALQKKTDIIAALNKESDRIKDAIITNNLTYEETSELATDLDKAENTTLSDNSRLIHGMGLRNLILLTDDFFFTLENSLISSVSFKIDFKNSLSELFNNKEDLLIENLSSINQAA